MNTEATLKQAAQIIWAQAGPVQDEKYWEEIWEYETRPERVAQTGEWWPITAARQIMALGLLKEEEIVAATALAKEKPSVSYLQRKMRIPYSHAMRLMEHLEARQIVSPPNHANVRTYLADAIAICPDCRGERRGPDGTLCKRCGGAAQIRRSELKEGEKAPFEPLIDELEAKAEQIWQSEPKPPGPPSPPWSFLPHWVKEKYRRMARGAV